MRARHAPTTDALRLHKDSLRIAVIVRLRSDYRAHGAKKSARRGF
jgi:hypothetical protein